jgi:hypothetical protein
MTVDETGVAIGASPVRMIGLVLAGVLMTAASGFVAVMYAGRSDDFAEIFGGLAAVFFGACTVMLLWRWATTRGPVVTITPDGIRDVRVAEEIIPWGAVIAISTWQSSGQSVMVLAVDPAVEAHLTLTRVARWSRGPNRLLGADGLCITAQGLQISYDQLLATCQTYAQTYGARM